MSTWKLDAFWALSFVAPSCSRWVRLAAVVLRQQKHLGSMICQEMKDETENEDQEVLDTIWLNPRGKSILPFISMDWLICTMKLRRPFFWGGSLSCPQCWWSRKSKVLITRCRSSCGFLPRQLPQCEQRRRWCHYDDFVSACGVWFVGITLGLLQSWVSFDFSKIFGLELVLSIGCVESFPGRHVAWVGVSFLGGCLLNRTGMPRLWICHDLIKLIKYEVQLLPLAIPRTCRASAAIRGFKLSPVAHRDRTGADVSSVVKVRDGRRGQAYRHSWDSVTCHDFLLILWQLRMHRNATFFKAIFLAKSHKNQTIFQFSCWCVVHFLSLNWLSFGKA